MHNDIIWIYCSERFKEGRGAYPPLALDLFARQLSKRLQFVYNLMHASKFFFKFYTNIPPYRLTKS